jgi:hypothetical protein
MVTSNQGQHRFQFIKNEQNTMYVVDIKIWKVNVVKVPRFV